MKTNKLTIFIMLSLVTALTPFISNNAFSQISNDTELYPVRVNGKEGYIDATGRMVIQPWFDAAYYFSEGLARIRIADGDCWKYGYIDKTGKYAISPHFIDARDFSEGLACAWISRKHEPGQSYTERHGYGYIDKTGKTIINPQFDFAYPFSEGLACVSIGDSFNGKKGFINKTGKYVINPQFEWFFTEDKFSEGLVCVGIDRNSIHFIDKSGQPYFNMYCRYSSEFSEGLAYVTIGDKEGFIDKTGKFVIYCQDGGYYHPFKEGMSRVSYSKYDYIDGDYREVDEKIGFIDKTGRKVVTQQFDKAEDFSEGLACVRVGGRYGKGRYGFIDKTGIYVINPQYDYAESFRGELAPVVINDTFHYINKNGDIIWTGSELPNYISDAINALLEVEEYTYKYRK